MAGTDTYSARGQQTIARSNNNRTGCRSGWTSQLPRFCALEPSSGGGVWTRVERGGGAETINERDERHRARARGRGRARGREPRTVWKVQHPHVNLCSRNCSLIIRYIESDSPPTLLLYAKVAAPWDCFCFNSAKRAISNNSRFPRNGCCLWKKINVLRFLMANVKYSQPI